MIFPALYSYILAFVVVLQLEMDNLTACQNTQTHAIVYVGIILLRLSNLLESNIFFLMKMQFVIALLHTKKSAARDRRMLRLSWVELSWSELWNEVWWLFDEAWLSRNTLTFKHHSLGPKMHCCQWNKRDGWWAINGQGQIIADFLCLG